MSIKLTNISGGQLVCDLKTKTLRLDNKKSETIQEVEMTPYIETCVKKGLLVSEKIQEEIPVEAIKKATASSKKVKED